MKLEESFGQLTAAQKWHRCLNPLTAVPQSFGMLAALQTLALCTFS